MLTMTQQQVYDIIDRWNTPVGQCYEKWKELYNFLPPPPPNAATKWAEAAQIAAVYDGPPV